MKRLVVGSIAAVLVLITGVVASPAELTAAKAKAPTPTPAATSAPVAQATTASASKSPSTSGSKALDARLGGTKASFEAKYGQPVPGGTTQPNVAVYQVQNYGQVAVAFNGSDVVGIVAVADRLGHQPLTAPDKMDWSVSSATRDAKAFLPEDAAFDTKPMTSSGTITGACHSQALAAAITQSTFSKLGAKGKPGDCVYVLNEDTNGSISSITIALGNSAAGTTQSAAATQAPATATSSTRASTSDKSSASKRGSTAVIKHCSDFKTRAEAQAYFDEHGRDSSPEVRGMDKDKDGKACEALK